MFRDSNTRNYGLLLISLVLECGSWFVRPNRLLLVITDGLGSDRQSSSRDGHLDCTKGLAAAVTSLS